jgi:hypothetical protein
MTELPVACCLSAAELAERERDIRGLFADALTGSDRDGSLRLVLRFRKDARDRVEQLAAAERRCCAFLTFTVTDSAMEIEAPPDAGETLDGFAALADEVLQV